MNSSPLMQLGANLFSLALALALGWPAERILLLYWAENVVVAFWQMPRILLAGKPPGGLPPLSNLFTSLFFLFHYGLFTLVHGMFVFQLFLHQKLTPETLAANLGGVGMGLAVLGLLISHGVDFFQDLGSGRLATADAAKVMGEPYRRIVVLHLVVLGSGFLLTVLPYPQLALVLLALVKTFMDLGLWQRRPQAAEEKNVARI